MKGETDSNAIKVSDFNTPLSTTVRSFKQKINKETADLNNIDKMDLTDIYKTFYPTAAEYTFKQLGTFSKDTLGYKRLKLHQLSFLTTMVGN